MKRFTPLICTLLLCGCIMEEQFDIKTPARESQVNTTQSDYYWFNGNREPLQKIPEYSFVITDEDATGNLSTIITRSGISHQGMEYKRYPAPKKAFRISDESQTVWSKIPTTILNENETNVFYSAPYFRTADGFEVGLTNYFMIKLKAASDLEILKQFANEHKVLVLYGDETDLWYTLTCTSDSDRNALELANKAYESGKFAATDVEFVDDIHFTSAPSYDDSLYSTQWNLNGEYGINLDATHSITTGSDNITVAVIDNGFILDHPDMPINAALSWDANSQTSPARQYYYSNATSNNHGIGVAGIIGAVQDNGKGIVGIAPGVKLMAISVRTEMHDSTDLTALNALKDAIYYAEEHNADVINNSWITNIKHQLLDDAIESSLRYGRNGKGCVVIFASGNDGTNISKMPYRDNEDVICVGGTTIDGYRWLGSNYSEHIDIVAPGSYIPTLGEDPENRNPDGTSFAAPHVSAIAGLMLSVNSALTSTQVGEILARTATKLPEYNFSSSKNNGTWDGEVGYGLANCYNAVRMAQNYFDSESYLNLIEFDYSGTNISLTLKASKDAVVIWNEGDQDYSFIPIGSSVTLSHNYSTSGNKHVIIAEYISENGSTPTSSTALTRFELTTGNNASNIDIKAIDSALEYIRIIGGANFASQSVSINGLSALKELYLVQLKNASISVKNCSSLTTFGTSRHIWRHRDFIPFDPNGTGTLNPDIVGGGGTSSNEWPTIPEPHVSPSSLSIINCPLVNTLSLENAGFTSFSFHGLDNLNYVYLSSQSPWIVGAASNPAVSATSGYFLSSAISTLPGQTPSSKGKIVIRCVNNSNTGYIPVAIGSGHKSRIQNLCNSKYWTLVWDSGIN